MMRFAIPAVFVLFAMDGACTSSTDCEIAQATVDRCDAANAAMTDSLSYRRLPLSFAGECSGVNACAASCVNGTSCTAIISAELTSGVQSTDPDAPPAPKEAGLFIGCIQKCLDLGRGM